jgi:hypothetical protein
MSHLTITTPKGDSPDHTFMFLLMAIPLLLGAMGILALGALIMFLTVLL